MDSKPSREALADAYDAGHYDGMDQHADVGYCQHDGRKYAAALPSESPSDPDANVWSYLDGATVYIDDDSHVAHRGNHIGYACGFSGPHCWECNEPWPCRAVRKDARLAALSTGDET